ncbi:MAG: HEAT repeat domain-containing protein [Labilithrix sp.]|nr:HEAT repeat domain-containing protein [Labilithrix sp.]
MTATSLAAWMTGALVAFAIVPTVVVLAREGVRRRRTRAALARVAEATRASVTPGDAGVIARNLRERFDPATVERAVEELLRSGEQASRDLGARLFAELELVTRYAETLRSARKWSERAHAAELLGLAGASSAVPALVAAMNDRYEDAMSVKSAATTALAKLRDPTAIPLLVGELVALDEGSARSVAEALVAFESLAVTPLLELLADPSRAAARVWAARVLGRIGDPRATEDLVTRLHDRDDLLRMAAAEALGAIADARATQPLIRATLRDPAPQVRAHAAAAVARIEGERAIDVLVAALADPDYATRLRALEAFEAIRVEDTSHLESALRDPNVDVRRRAALALERVGYLDRVIGRLTSPDRATRERAYAALSELGSVGLLDSVVAYIHHESFEVRAIVARVSGELGASRVAPLLRGRLNDDAWPVRAALVEALGRLKAPGTASAIVELLVDPEEPVREAAADALTSFSPGELAEHVDRLTAAYDAGSVVVRTQMVILVARFEQDAAIARAAEPLLVRASVDASDAVRLRAVTALGDRSGELCVQALVARLTDASLDVRMAAVAALGSAASTEAFEGLLGALAGAAPALRDRIADSLSRGARQQLFLRLDELEKASSLDVRLGVAWTLGKCGVAAGVPVLARFLRDASPVLRASAAGALAKIAGPEAREALLTAAEDPNGRVRAAVVNALGRAPSGEPRVVATLERCTRDPDAFVRNRALVSLACVAGESVEPRLDELGREADGAARLVAAAVVGTESSLATVLDGIAAPGALEGVMKFLAHEDPAVRAAFFAAVHLDDPTAVGPERADVPALVAQYESLLRTSLDVAARRFAVRALGRISGGRGASGGRSADVLADALTSDPAEDVRLQAARALAPRRDDAVARRALVRAVGDPSADVAIGALQALAGRRDPEVALALARRLGAGPPRVQRLTESTLADIHRDDPWPFLDWMMGVDVPDLLVPAVRVLEQMASPATAPLLAELVRSRSSSLRAAAVRALGALPSPDTTLLATLAEDPSEDVRLAVLETMTWSGESLLRGGLLRNDPSVRVRTALAVSLARFEGAATKSALKVVRALLDDASPVVRAAALATLLESRDPAGLHEFVHLWPATALDVRFELRAEPRAVAITESLAARLTTSTEAPSRRAAVTAMGALGVPSVEERLAPALQDPSPDVRVAAIQALAALDLPSARARIAQMASDPDGSVREAARRSVVRTVG